MPKLSSKRYIVYCFIFLAMSIFIPACSHIQPLSEDDARSIHRIYLEETINQEEYATQMRCNRRVGNITRELMPLLNPDIDPIKIESAKSYNNPPFYNVDLLYSNGNPAGVLYDWDRAAATLLPQGFDAILYIYYTTDMMESVPPYISTMFQLLRLHDKKVIYHGIIRRRVYPAFLSEIVLCKFDHEVAIKLYKDIMRKDIVQ